MPRYRKVVLEVTLGLARPVWASVDPMMREYYDTEWGMPVRDEQGMYERISLEAFQAGLSWATILRKRPAFRTAFDGFDPEVVSRYGEAEVERLVGLGATRLADHDEWGHVWTTLADPAGNEFCVAARRARVTPGA